MDNNDLNNLVISFRQYFIDRGIPATDSIYIATQYIMGTLLSNNLSISEFNAFAKSMMAEYTMAMEELERTRRIEE